MRLNLLVKIYEILGAPAELENKQHPDWIPNQNMGYVTSRQPDKASVSRVERLSKRKKVMEVEVCILNLFVFF